MIAIRGRWFSFVKHTSIFQWSNIKLKMKINEEKMSPFWSHFPGLLVPYEWYQPAHVHIWNCWVMKAFSSLSWVSYNYCVTANSSNGKEFKMGLKMLLYVTLMTLKSHENEKNYRYQHPFIFVCGQIPLRDFLQNWVRIRQLKKSQV